MNFATPWLALLELGVKTQAGIHVPAKPYHVPAKPHGRHFWIWDFISNWKCPI